MSEGGKEIDIGRLGLTKLGDVVGQAPKTRPRDEDTDVASMRRSEDR